MMTCDIPTGGNHANSQERRAALQEVIDTANYLASRYRYSEAIRLLGEVIDPSAVEATTKQLVSRATDLQARIIKRRRDILLRIYIAAVGIFSLAIVGYLYFFPVASVEIVAEIKTEGLFANIREDAYVSIDYLESLILSNPEKLVFYSNAVNVVTNRRQGEPIQQVKPKRFQLNPNIGAQIKTVGGAGGTRVKSELLALHQLKLLAGHSLKIIIAAGNSPGVTLLHDTAESEARIQTGSEAIIDCDGCRLEQAGKAIVENIDFLSIKPSPYELSLESRTSPVYFTFELPVDIGNAQPVPTISETIGVSTIDFTRSRSGRIVSLIKGGKVEITDIDGRTVEIAESEYVDFGNEASLTITGLQFGKPMTVQFRGKVKSFRSGFGNRLHSRMPSRLDWLVNNKLRTLFFSSVSALFTFLIAAFVKLRFIEKI